MVLLALGPLAVLAVASVARGWRWPLLWPAEWGGEAWRYVFAGESGMGEALGASAGLAAAVTVCALAMALPAARVLAWRRFAGKRAVFFVLLLPVFAPPFAAGMGLHALFLRLGLAETWAGVMLAHLMPAVPYAVLMLTGSYTRLDPDLEAQARTLGAGPREVFRRVTLPALAPGLAVAGVFVFLVSWSQYLLTVLIGGGRTVTLPVALVATMNGGDPAVAAALTLVFVGPALAVFAVAARHLRYEV